MKSFDPHPSQNPKAEPPYTFPSVEYRLEQMPLKWPNGNHMKIEWELSSEPIYHFEIDDPHFLMVGATRSGKTTLMELLQYSALKDKRYPDIPLRYRAMINDPKQEQIPLLHRMGFDVDRDVIITNPFDTRSSAWAIHEDLNSTIAIQDFVSVICPTSPIGEVDGANGGNQAFWNNVSNQLLHAVIAGLKERTKDSHWDLRDVVLVTSDWAICEEIIRATPRGESAWDQYFVRGGYELKGSCESTFRSRIKQIEVTAALWSHAKTRFSVKKWRENGSIILLGYNAEAMQVTSMSNYLLVRAALQACNSMPGGDYGKRDDLTWVFLDELTTFGKVPNLVDAVNYSAGKGVRIVISALSFENLKRAFSRPTDGLEVINSIKNKAILQLQSYEDAEYAAKLIGTSHQQDVKHTVNRDGGGSDSYGKKRQYMVWPENIMNLPIARENGISAYFLSEYGTRFSQDTRDSEKGLRLNYEAVKKRLPPELPDSELPEAFIERPPEHQDIDECPWTQSDYDRLGIQPKPTSKQDNVRATKNRTDHSEKKPRLRLD